MVQRSLVLNPERGLDACSEERVSATASAAFQVSRSHSVVQTTQLRSEENGLYIANN